MMAGLRDGRSEALPLLDANKKAAFKRRVERFRAMDPLQARASVERSSYSALQGLDRAGLPALRGDTP